ncbi:MAG: cupin domain-containing protein [Acidobacteriaceae bacterium]|nr:cupin domain-containing protein [Acidobacteriaceae bacterium]
MSLLEMNSRPGLEPPLHIHRNEDESFYVLEGRLKVTRDSEELILEPGDSGFLPRGIPHTFKILSSNARWLVYLTPAGFEEYFRTLARLANQFSSESNPPRPDYERLGQVAAQFGITFVR